MKLVILCVLWQCVSSQQPWSLQRAENDQYRIVFKNTTVTGKLMLTSWSWRDSLAGIWDTSLRISLANDSFRSGHLQYRDGYGNEMIRVRWQQSPFTNVTWKALFISKFPSTSWNMTSDYVNWGYRPINEFTWGFYVNEYTFEAKPTNAVAAPLEDAFGLWLRRKRSVLNRRKRFASREPPNSAAFSFVDLFAGDGIFSSLPQMLINIFSFFANLFPAKDEGYSGVGDGGPTEPEAEVVTTTKATDMALRRTTPLL